MKVENATSQAYLRQPNFQGTGDISRFIRNNLPGKKAFNVFDRINGIKGEIGGIVINSIGTGAVAPFVIGTNPFVKAPKGASEEEKKKVRDTKWYTAMRQPISAILAVLFQVGALVPINKWIDKIFNDPELAKHVDLYVDQSVLNSDATLKRKAKAELSQQNTKKPSFWSQFSKGRKAFKAEKAEYKAKLKGLADEIGSKQLDDLTNSFEATGKIKIGDRYLDNKALAKLINQQIDSYIKDAKDLKLDNDKLTFYSKRADLLINNEDKLKEIFSSDVLNSQMKNNTDFEGLEKYLKDLLNKEQNPEIKEILQELLDRPEDVRLSRINNTLKRIDSIKDVCDGKYTQQKYFKVMTDRNAELDKIITKFSLDKLDPKSAIEDNTIRTTIDKIKKVCSFKENDKFLRGILHDTDTFNSDIAKLSKKIHKDIIKGYKGFVKNHFSGISQIIQILIGVGITLPITCNALNWVYPRAMELFFPKLSGVKKASKGGENNG